MMPSRREVFGSLPAATASRVILGLALACALAGCVKPPSGGDGKRYLWPPSVMDAKIEYLGFLATDMDLRRGKFDWFEEVVLGKDPARPLFHIPYAIDARFGKLAVTDVGSSRVLLFDLLEGRYVPIGEGSETESGLVFPTGVALTNAKEMWVVDSTTANVRRYTLEGKALGAFGKNQLTRPTSIAVARTGDHVVVADTPAHRLAIFTNTGELVGYLGERGNGPGQFNFPVDADFAPDGELFVLDAMNARVQRFRREGDTYRFVGDFGERGTAAGSFTIAKSLAVTPSGHVYVTDAMSHKVVVFDRDGTFLLTFGGQYVSIDGKVSPGGFSLPRGITADESDGLWVVDSLNRMVHHFQYLNEAYLREHPVSREQVFLPGWGIGGGK